MMQRNANVPTASRAADQWSRLIEEWRRTGQLLNEFCRERGLSPNTFKWWRWAVAVHGGRPPSRRPRSCRGLPRRSPSVTAPPSAPRAPAFIELVGRATPLPGTVDSRPSGVEIVVPRRQRDCRVRVAAGFDVATLRQVVSVLEEV